MNMKETERQWRKFGIRIERSEISGEGIVFELSMDPVKGVGWEQLEDNLGDALELTVIKNINAYTKWIRLIPACTREFKYYINKYIKTYGVSKRYAMYKLETAVTTYGSLYAHSNFESFKRNFGK